MLKFNAYYFMKNLDIVVVCNIALLRNEIFLAEILQFGKNYEMRNIGKRKNIRNQKLPNRRQKHL